ncbi:M13 family metallopeptidase [Litorihabitans aurantiacus]|uniref:Peptidase M13 n=1 Tax=Litorihabitans aurantiacus TaxID=1930061 RepID=A0AA38CSV7_9MICO|nr:M13-type metalloendopeptidase [Litorihabitans aurantiacus]GMA31899.1 peptidase M13 [Litorihabitans aurantiacus]
MTNPSERPEQTSSDTSPTSGAHPVPPGGDPAVRVQDDLYRHVNGTWLREHVIPADRSRDGEFHRLRDEAEEHVRAIVERASAQAADGEGSGDVSADTARIAALYSAFMDTAAIEAAGLAPLAVDLDLVTSVQHRGDLARVLGELQLTGVGGAVGLYVDTDSSEPDHYALHLAQSGLGLPDEAYYREPQHAETLAAYEAHVARQLAATTGLDAAAAAASAAVVLALETRLAAGHWDRVRDRDAVATHNPTTREELAQLLTGFDLEAWLGGLGITEAMLARVDVREPSYLEAFAQAWADVDLADWRTWLTWRVVRSRAPYLTAAVVEENFDFYGRTLTGAEEIRERWKRGVGLVEGALGDALAKLYVAEHFPPDHKARMDELVANLVEAYRRSITDLDWMSPATRERALEKLAAFTPKIGYPVRWRDYSDLDLSGDLLASVRATSAHETRRELGKLGGEVDRDEWFMTPQTVNAYYNPGMNEIVFPAAILQAPFFDPDATDAANYGGIGAVIGHEIGHGFDDQGSRYDGEGRLADWWTQEDRAEFEVRTSALIAQYDALSPAQLAGSHHVNGGLTVGENIGDLGGLSIAIKAYRIALAAASPAGVDADVEHRGLVDLFHTWGLIWRTKSRDAEAIRLLSIDPHSPEEFRANAVVRNVDEFAQTFDVRPGDELWLEPSERVRIW